MHVKQSHGRDLAPGNGTNQNAEDRSLPLICERIGINLTAACENESKLTFARTSMIFDRKTPPKIQVSLKIPGTGAH
jgi:hypothetical protein